MDSGGPGPRNRALGGARIPHGKEQLIWGTASPAHCGVSGVSSVNQSYSVGRSDASFRCQYCSHLFLFAHLFIVIIVVVPRAGFKCVEALGTIVIRGQSGGVLVWLSAWSKEQTTLDLHINSMTYTLFFYSRLSVSKSIFMFL